MLNGPLESRHAIALTRVAKTSWSRLLVRSFDTFLLDVWIQTDRDYLLLDPAYATLVIDPLAIGLHDRDGVVLLARVARVTGGCLLGTPLLFGHLERALHLLISLVRRWVVQVRRARMIPIIVLLMMALARYHANLTRLFHLGQLTRIPIHWHLVATFVLHVCVVVIVVRSV